MTEIITELPKEIIYSSYTESQKKATLKYREKNKDKVNEQRKIYYQQRKENDPDFLKYKRAKSREYYQRKKEAKMNNDNIDLVKIDIENEPEIVIEEVKQDEGTGPEIPIIEEVKEVKEVKEKVKRTKKVKIPELEPQPEIQKTELIEFDKNPDEEIVSTVLVNAIVKKNSRKKSKITYDI